MANLELLIPFLHKWEGPLHKFTNGPSDLGGTTCGGVTFKTFQRVFGEDKTIEDLKNITEEQFIEVARVIAWDVWKADEIKSQAIAEMLSDWVWGSGIYGVKLPQRLLGVKEDGIVGPNTILSLNLHCNKSFYSTLYSVRKLFLSNIVKNNPSQSKWINGWNARLLDLYNKGIKEFV